MAQKFICSNPACLQRYKDNGSFLRHLKYSSFGCTTKHFKLYTKYLAGLKENPEPDNTIPQAPMPKPPDKTIPSSFLDNLEPTADHLSSSHPTLHLSNAVYHPAPLTSSALDTHLNTMPNTVMLADQQTVDSAGLQADLFFNPWIDSQAGKISGGITDPSANPSDNLPSRNLSPPVLPQSTSAPRYRPPTALPTDPMSRYNQIRTEAGFTYEHADGGQSFGSGTRRWEEVDEFMSRNYPGRPWGIWKDKQEWEIARWMSTKKVSQSDLDELLATELFQNSSLTFKTAKQLFDRIEVEMSTFGGPEWEVREIQLTEAPSETHILVFRDLKKCGDHLIRHPNFAGHLITKPSVRVKHDNITQVYREMADAKEWNRLQNDPNLPPGTTLGGMMLASDKTGLSSHAGDVVAHGLYMSLANIPKAMRSRDSRTAWMLVAYIPTSKWRRTLRENEHLSNSAKTDLVGVLSRRLFHRSMSIITRPLRRTIPHQIIDADGKKRMILYVLMAYIADLEEQLWIAGLGSLCCPHCDKQSTNLGDEECGHVRTSGTILEDIRKVLTRLSILNGQPNVETALEFLRESRKHGLCGVKKPFWVEIPGLDICKVLSMDLLHGFYKLFFDHLYSWNRAGLGAAELDARMASQIQLAGDRVYANGVSRISQMTGKEHRDLLSVHVAVIANAPNEWSSLVTRATCALIDCIYMARYKEVSDDVLVTFKNSYQLLHRLKHVWIDNETRRASPESDVIEHFNIPKMHILRHLPEQVGAKGPLDNVSTETMERLHIEFIKWAYRASNHRDWIPQAIGWLNRHERISGYSLWLEHRRQKDLIAGQEGGQPGVERERAGGSRAYKRTPGGEAIREGDALGQQSLLQQQPEVLGLGKREREAVKDGNKTQKRARHTVNGTSENQVVNVEPAISRKSLASIANMLGENVDSFLASIESLPEIFTEGFPVTPDTQFDLWHSIRIQSSNDPVDDLQRVRTAANCWSNQTEALGPDPVLYLALDKFDPTRSPEFHGISCRIC
ncbi:hypothetical protein RhiLY_01372 [Ceratobasidium sp. AG-Ba]|nr:hypothetical protein RhiLY_01372 [Ceratobasidium sp. AG-Ba]